MLILLFGVHPATAVGIDLLYASVTKTIGTLVHRLSRTGQWHIVRMLASGSVPATALTAAAHRTVPGISPAVPGICRHSARDRHAATSQDADLTGAVLGVLVTISSVGAGAIGVTILLLLYPRLPMAIIVGSDIAHAVPLPWWLASGTCCLGSVDWSLLTSLSPVQCRA